MEIQSKSFSVVDEYSINEQFDRVCQLLDRIERSDNTRQVVVLDAEVSYTYKFFELAAERGSASVIKNHWIPYQSVVHCFKHAEEWPYYPQWQFGLRIDVVDSDGSDSIEYFFISNLEKYKEKSIEFVERFKKVLPKVVLVGQNIKFDFKLLIDIMNLSHLEVLNCKCCDLMMLSYALGVEQKRLNLKKLAQDHLSEYRIEPKTEEKYEIYGTRIDVDWKHEESFHRTLLEGRFDETILYNREDIIITHALYRELFEKRSDPKQEGSKQVIVSKTIYEWFIPFHTLIERVGLYLDEQQAEKEFLESCEESLVKSLDIAVKSSELFRLMRESGAFSELKKYLESLKTQDKEVEEKAKRESKDIPEKKYDKFLAKYSFFDFEHLDFYDTSEVLDTKDRGRRVVLGKKCVNLVIITGSIYREFIAVLLGICFKENPGRTTTGMYAFQKDTISEIVERLSLSKDQIDVILCEILREMLDINSLKANLARLQAFFMLPNKLYPDHRLHHEFKLAGTETGRLSNVRPGVMNMPMRIKKLIRCKEEGGKVVQIDLSSAEAKLFMLLTQNESILEELKTDPDTYSVIGRKVFNIEMNKKTRPIERNLMKIGVLAKLYGQSLYGLAEQISHYYDHIKWNIYLFRDKYEFLYKWNVLDFRDEAVCEEIKSRILSFDVDQEQLRNMTVEDDRVRSLLNDLNDEIQINYLQLAVECDRELSRAINSDDYEKWVCTKFIDFSDRGNSKVYSPVGLLRTFNMGVHSNESIRHNDPLFSDGSKSKDAQVLLYGLYKAFFLDDKTFIGTYWTKKVVDGRNRFEQSLIKVTRLHAFAAVVNKIKKADNSIDTKRFTPEDYDQLIALLEEYEEPTSAEKKLDEDDARNSIRNRIHNRIQSVIESKDLKESFVNAGKKLQARYRESLNFPIQGTSSFINSYVGYKVWKRCLEEHLDVLVINTIHDANHFELPHFERDGKRFIEIAEDEYANAENLETMLRNGLTSMHPKRMLDDFKYISIGSAIEVCDNIGEAK